MDYQSLQLPEGVVGWIYNYSRQNYWRVAEWIEIDDLIQEGLLAAYKCRERYGDVDPAHFMRLTQITFKNRITDLVRVTLGCDDSTKLADLWKKENGSSSESDVIDRLSEPADALQEFAILIAELPIHLRNAVELLINDPVQFRKALRVKFDSPSETMSGRLARLIGWPEHLDFETELRSYLWERQRGLLNWETSALKARIDRLKTG